MKISKISLILISALSSTIAQPSFMSRTMVPVYSSIGAMTAYACGFLHGKKKSTENTTNNLQFSQNGLPCASEKPSKTIIDKIKEHPYLSIAAATSCAIATIILIKKIKASLKKPQNKKADLQRRLRPGEIDSAALQAQLNDAQPRNDYTLRPGDIDDEAFRAQFYSQNFTNENQQPREKQQ